MTPKQNPDFGCNFQVASLDQSVWSRQLSIPSPHPLERLAKPEDIARTKERLDVLALVSLDTI